MNATKSLLSSALALSFLVCSAANAQTTAAQSTTAQSTKANTTYKLNSYNNIELGLIGGYANGKSVQVFVNYNNLAGPIGARLSVTNSSNGNGFDDNADLSAGLLGTIGQQKKSGLIMVEGGSLTSYGLDATYDLGQPVPGVATSVYGGVRYGQFNSRLQYAGQYTDYSSKAFGVGVGSQVGYLLTNNISLIGDLGVDQYFHSGPITSRDNKNNTDTFKPEEASYAAVNKAVIRPSTVFKAMLGVKYSF